MQKSEKLLVDFTIPYNKVKIRTRDYPHPTFNSINLIFGQKIMCKNKIT